jgi:hypothetical protein
VDEDPAVGHAGPEPVAAELGEELGGGDPAGGPQATSEATPTATEATAAARPIERRLGFTDGPRTPA